MSDDVQTALREFGAAPSQLVDLNEESPRSLPYVDLARLPPEGGVPTVFEAGGQPQAYVFDSRGTPPKELKRWVRRIAFRGDANWVGVLRPGRLDVYRAALGNDDEPQQLIDLPDGPLRLPWLLHRQPASAAPSIRAAILALMRRSLAEARDLGADTHDALSLVGRALFWRFLVDRGLLEGLEPAQISPGATSFASCLDDKQRALSTFEWLEATFDGGLLPLTRPTSRLPADIFRRVLGNIAHSADTEGQLTLRLPGDWTEVNFAHIPVGLLSEVYEAHAHDADAKKAKAESVFYTPRHIAEFVVAEALEPLATTKTPRVLDPSAGAGVFLVAAFRALVKREWEQSGEKPSRKTIRRILDDQLVGFDINEAALRLAQLALYLTAIELDPVQRPRPLALLKFRSLEDRALFCLPGGTEGGSLGPVEPRFREQFDLVVGNPPWTAMKASQAAQRRWAEDSKDIVSERLGAERAAIFAFPKSIPDLPFVYRAMRWVRSRGQVALVTHARWLFGQARTMIQARNDLLQSISITGILNGTALRDTNVWPNIRHPFCIVFATNEAPAPGSTFQFVSPSLDTVPDSNQVRLRIDWSDAVDVDVNAVIERPWVLKARFRGGAFDVEVIEKLRRKGVPLGEYLAGLKTGLENGYKLGAHHDGQTGAKHMRGFPDLRGCEPDFFVDAKTLPEFSRSTLHRPRDWRIYRGPLLLVRGSIRADSTAPRATISLAETLAFDERFDGASFADVPNGEDIARYLQLVLQSSVFKHALLMLDGQLGVEREVIHLKTIESVPVVPWHTLKESAKAQSRALSKSLENGDSTVLSAVDKFIQGLFDLDDVSRDAIEDTLATALPTAAGKQSAVRTPSVAEHAQFARICEKELRSILLSSNKSAFVRVHDALKKGPWCVLQIDRVKLGESAPPLVSIDIGKWLEAADDASASLVDVEINSRTRLFGALDRYRYWTPTRARTLAVSILT
ncbi:MAG: N-6 DNA methylase [Myxococcaceae bacterium]